jgi:2-polyprenyl-3-methyl-5-hydroxy-6-metoxy-1,4-benzoquinol methylase
MTWDYHADPRPDIQALVVPAGRRFLDVGCGGGALARSLKEAGAAHVAGIEVNPAAAARAREHIDAIVEGGVLEAALPFAAGEFDYLIFADVLEHLTDPSAALRRCLPYLAPRGRVIVSVPNMRFYLVLLRLMFDRWSYADAGVRDRTHLRIFTRRSLLAMLAAERLELERLERNFRVVEDQSEIGRVGALATRVARATVAPLLFPDLMAYQYIAVARQASTVPAGSREHQ